MNISKKMGRKVKLTITENKYIKILINEIKS